MSSEFFWYSSNAAPAKSVVTTTFSLSLPMTPCIVDIFILGFSQGAATTAALCRLQLEDSKDPYLSSIKFQFAILISGFIPSHGLYINDSKHDEMTILNGKFDTLHIFGSSDEITQVLEMICQVAPVDISVLISGESGAG